MLSGGGGATFLAIAAALVGYWWKTRPERAYRKWLSDTLAAIRFLIEAKRGNMITVEDKDLEFARRAVGEGHLAMPFPNSVTLASLVDPSA
jgi:hypothetical protein